ncbi:hypothetical protein [Paenibacillus agri]|uniref:Uncharacterized protein n=1 Tax=Paenibacillus agri TaxID=2744309 RepID=A0A850ES26_9BACL|nr:hypothetical protein [Paenibacillus agri]NUU61572.1 hypothetical protein [Paenibacillus agri]
MELKSINIAVELSKLSKDDLVTLLVNFSEDIDEVKRALSLRFMDTDDKNALSEYKKIIRSYIKQSSDRYGFVTYRNVSYAVVGAEQIMKQAEDALEGGKAIRAAEISFCVMHEMGNLLQKCDDSGGIVGGMIQECLSLVRSVTTYIEESDRKVKSKLFKLLLKEAGHSSLKGWSDWQLSLLESAVHVMTDHAEKDLWNDTIKRLVSEEDSHLSKNSYFLEHSAWLRYQIIERFDGESQAQQYLQSHLEYTVFRKKAIEQAIQKQDLDKALQLAKQGEKKDRAKRFHGLVNEWKAYQYEIYGLTNQLEKQIEIAEEFVLDGEYLYYSRLKGLYSADDWKIAYERLLNELNKSDRSWSADSLYRRILVEENETQRLFNYVKEYKRAVLEYYPHLVSKYADDVFALFSQLILEETAVSSNRKEYQKVCGMIRHLIKAGGKLQAEMIIEQLCNDYPKRSAMIDELQKIKL